MTIRDREVGGSNPLAPTINIKHLRLPTLAALFRLWPFVDTFFNQSNSLRQFSISL